MPLAGTPAVLHTIHRLRAMTQADEVVVATTDSTGDDPLADYLESQHVPVFRGSEHDVLARYLAAAEAFDADTIIRVTCDCPLLDPAVCDDVARLHRKELSTYTSNIAKPEWPHGLDCEIVDTKVLADSYPHTSDEEREHVTLHIRRRRSFRQAHLHGPGAPATQIRWTLDYPEDYEHLCRVFELDTEVPTLGWEAIAVLMDQDPSIARINACRVVPERR